MMKDADSHADEDRKLRESAEAKNRAEQLIYTTENTLKQLGDKVSSEDKLAIENAMSELRAAVESNDAQRINQATEALQQASYKLSQALYEQAAKAEGGPQPGPEAEGQPPGEAPPEDEGVIDAEFKEE